MTPKELERQRRYRAARKAKERAADEAMEGRVAPVSEDVADTLRRRYIDIITMMSDEELLDRANSPALAQALKAQSLIDKRAAAKPQFLESRTAFALVAMVTNSVLPAQQLGDGAVEGEVRVVTPEEDAPKP